MSGTPTFFGESQKRGANRVSVPHPDPSPKGRGECKSQLLPLLSAEGGPFWLDTESVGMPHQTELFGPERAVDSSPGQSA